ncbi:NAD(P)-binding domain-containing protein [Niallia taxi]|uniref:NAD(P)/FAD-dependent oxidoreductase n=1 Tax=Niallia taxi TaxID=2499688 RepID=A0A3S2UV02_9BACI|nr:NAD(P)-binding domain-containing protein [Niallia taxi]MDK8643019.1 NAD(P)-binding domain-containing protein [Niallia taxi]MED4038229.1 NAD(P)-binding domain-containing protein [Niallia taxi]MED4055122.1 NAD(P)-binding domain-containing protein [Niallia taxi]MED4120688.1 NAD(P)-binding domain-containing protein [Niallia taxi]RVT59392.1 NAD(P)/FAD-dependent oxidoreductase [Niallia taxi]
MSEFNILSSCCQPSDESQVKTTIDKELPIAIVGAGPVGLAAAAHLIQYKQKVILLEAGTEVGSNILTWKHIRLFSQWKYNIDKAASSLLEKYKWEKPNLEEIPTGKELVENYLIPLSKIPEIQEVIALNTKVISIAKKNIDKLKTANRENVPFVIYTEHEGTIQAIEARAVIDATGTWGNPNPANSSGVWLESEKHLKENIFYGLPDILGESISRYKNKKVAVIGSGHSAINALLELGILKEKNPATEILWVIRKEHVEDAYGGEEKDALKARGLLGSKIHEMVDKGIIQVYTSFKIEQLKKNNTSTITIIGEIKGVKSEIDLIDEVIVNTGNRPNYSFLSELRTKVDFATESVEELSSLIDPNLHSCGTVRPHGEKVLRQPEKNLYVVGSKSYGRAPTFLMATGYEQVRSIAAYIAGDIEAAEKVELDLPETGVCSVNFSNIKSDRSCETDSCCS